MVEMECNELSDAYNYQQLTFHTTAKVIITNTIQTRRKTSKVKPNKKRNSFKRSHRKSPKTTPINKEHHIPTRRKNELTTSNITNYLTIARKYQRDNAQFDPP